MNAARECPSPLPLSPSDGERGIDSLAGVTQGAALGYSHLAPTGLQSAPAGAGGVRGRLPVSTVQRIERLVGGDPVTEDRILRFIAARYGAKNLLYLPPNVAAQICMRPADFLRAAKRFCEPELELS